MPISRQRRPLNPALSTDAALHDYLDYLLDSAIQRQLWVIALDDDCRQVGPFMPGSDLPEDPDEPVVTDDLGLTTSAHVLSQRMPVFAEAAGGTQVVLVWERPGSARLSKAESRWARRMANGCRGLDVRLRAQFLLHDDGLSRIPPVYALES